MNEKITILGGSGLDITIDTKHKVTVDKRLDNMWEWCTHLESRIIELEKNISDKSEGLKLDE